MQGTTPERPRQPRVLVAEDDEEMSKLLVRAFERAGCQVILARDGNEALAGLRPLVHASFGATPDLVLADLRLPGFSGFQVLETARLLSRNLPVFVISAFMDDEARDRAKRLRATGVVAKPVDLDELVSSLKRWLPQVPS